MKRLLQRLFRRLSATHRHAAELHQVAHRIYASGLPTAAGVVAAFNQLLTGAEIAPGATFGEGFRIHHSDGIVVSPDVVGGNDVHLYQQVTLGESWGDKMGAPKLGNRVVIFAGAKVLGDISIGDGARVGANAVVLEDVPPEAVVVGIPARVVSTGRQRAWER